MPTGLIRRAPPKYHSPKVTLTAKSAPLKTVTFILSPAVQAPLRLDVKPGALTADFSFKRAPTAQGSTPTIKAFSGWTALRPSE